MMTSSEIPHYDRAARAAKGSLRRLGSHAYLAAFERSLKEGKTSASYRAWVQNLARIAPEARVLDYCCGQGEQAVLLQKLLPRATLTGIDISPEAIGFAQALAEEEFPAAKKPSFETMDAHRLRFADGSFDAVMEFGALSSLRLEPALEEVHRVLRPGGLWLGIETLGHHPVANLKRRLNVLQGSRTPWAAAHILRTPDLERIRARFPDLHVDSFHLTTFEPVDRILFDFIPPLRRYAFKVVFRARKAS